MLRRDFARRVAVPRVIRANRLQGLDDVVDRAEREQSLPGREEGAEAGVLRDHGTAGREIADAAIAEPAAARRGVTALGDSDLAF